MPPVSPALLVCLLASPLWASTLLIVHKNGNSVGFYDGQTGQSLVTLPVHTKPHEVALSADGRLAYITNYGVDRYNQPEAGGNTISIIDTVDRKLAGEIDLGRYHRPHGIERGRSGMLFVTVDMPSALLVVDPRTKQIVRAIEAELNLPHMLELTADESTAFVANAGNGTVTVVDLQGKQKPKHLNVGGIPMGFALSADGRTLYAATRTANTIAVIDTAKKEIVRTLTLTGHPVRARLTPDGRRMLVSTIDAGDVAVLEVPSLRQVYRFHAGTHAEGLAADPNGKIGYVSAQDDHKVLQFSLEDGKVLREIKTDLRPDPIVVLPGQ